MTETSEALNPGLRGRDIREVFKGPDFHILLVANKFQTGFDQPLLCGMYVDKMLGGIQAVQTRSRLNRAYPGKDTTYVLDFVNEPAEILKAFKTYYETAEMEAVTDPHLVYDLRAKLDATGFYDDYEVDRVAKVDLDPNGTRSNLMPRLLPWPTVCSSVTRRRSRTWRWPKKSMMRRPRVQPRTSWRRSSYSRTTWGPTHVCMPS